MERIGAGVIIRGNGNEDFNVMMNGIASQEWKRMTAKFSQAMEAQRKEFEKKMEWMNMIKGERDKERAERLAMYAAMEKYKPNFGERVKEKIGFILGCLIVYGEALHMIKYVGGKENESINS